MAFFTQKSRFLRKYRPGFLEDKPMPSPQPERKEKFVSMDMQTIIEPHDKALRRMPGPLSTESMTSEAYEKAMEGFQARYSDLLASLPDATSSINASMESKFKGQSCDVSSGAWKSTSGERKVTSGARNFTSGERKFTSGARNFTSGDRRSTSGCSGRSSAQLTTSGVSQTISGSSRSRTFKCDVTKPRAVYIRDLQRFMWAKR